jgi:transcriptional regulator with XRE-family HTH domain
MALTGTQVRERREALGLTQTQLGAKLGKHKITVSRWETGTSPIDSPEMVDLALEALEKRQGRKRVKA